MSLEPKVTSDWQPSASLSMLKARAALYQAIRQFFASRHVLEVETPISSRYCVSDPYIDSFALDTKERARYLNTSPEYAMKRLLASGAGSIYQISKCFRQDEAGRYHNPEFSMLEWYRVDFDEHALIEEVDALLQDVLSTRAATKTSYRDIFLTHLEIDPHSATLDALNQHCEKYALSISSLMRQDKTHLLQTLFALLIEPKLGTDVPCVIYDFPKEQAALSQLSATNPEVACRFEVYYRGIELANGFFELRDAKEQHRRFQEDNQKRLLEGKEAVELDVAFLDALEEGLPRCSGVALGLDRLLMLKTKAKHIKEVLAFDWSRA